MYLAYCLFYMPEPNDEYIERHDWPMPSTCRPQRKVQRPAHWQDYDEGSEDE